MIVLGLSFYYFILQNKQSKRSSAMAVNEELLGFSGTAKNILSKNMVYRSSPSRATKFCLWLALGWKKTKPTKTQNPVGKKQWEITVTGAGRPE